jgi:hypothetical protein
VEEQLRSDRYKTLALKALPWVGGLLALALVVVLAVWGLRNQASHQDAKASETYAAALDTLQAGDKARAYAQFEAAAKGGSKAYKALSLMQLGGLRLADDRVPEAVTLFDQAAKAAPSVLIGDAARLQAVYALFDTASQADIDGRLKVLLGEGRPFRLQAREAAAMNKLAHGQAQAAREDFAALANGLDTPQGLRQRAMAAQAVIDNGGAANVVAIAKAARAIPPAALAQAEAQARAQEQAQAMAQAQAKAQAQAGAPSSSVQAGAGQ